MFVNIILIANSIVSTEKRCRIRLLDNVYLINKVGLITSVGPSGDYLPIVSIAAITAMHRSTLSSKRSVQVGEKIPQNNIIKPAS